MSPIYYQLLLKKQKIIQTKLTTIRKWLKLTISYLARKSVNKTKLLKCESCSMEKNGGSTTTNILYLFSTKTLMNLEP